MHYKMDYYKTRLEAKKGTRITNVMQSLAQYSFMIEHK